MMTIDDIKRIVSEVIAPLADDIKQIKGDVTTLKSDMAIVKRDVAELKRDVAALQGDVAELKRDVAELKRDVAELKGDVAELKRDVAELKGDVVLLKGDVAELKGNVVLLKSGVAELKGDVVQLNGNVAELKSRQEFVAYVSVIRLSNAMKGPTDPLKHIIHNYSGETLADTVEQPSMWAELAVGGAETVPMTMVANNWNRKKSKALLAAFYKEGGDSDTDGEGEYGLKARARRIAVAEVMGISASRISALASL